MGIKDFQPYIKKTYPDACSLTFTKHCDNLYVDLNWVLHHVCYTSTSVEDMLDRLRDYLRVLVAGTKPKKRLILAADGPAPLAKMILQRKRRLESIKTLNDEEAIDLDKKLNLYLSPGTEFMSRLEKSLEGFYTYIKKTYSIDILTYIIDADEGELKIKYHLQKIQKKNPTETHVVYSGDSDMILLLFTCSDLSKIYQIVNKNLTIDFGKLYCTHIKKFGTTENTKNDFVLINLLMGNDYLPKVVGINIDSLWKAYGELTSIYPFGLIKYENMKLTVDQLFFHDLLYIVGKNVKKYVMDRFSISDLRLPLYDDYVQGLFWCFGVYVTGVCCDYRYMYDYTASPHIIGAMMCILHQNTYTIVKSVSIDTDLYGILLIPEKAKSLLSKEQNMIAERLAIVHPLIYEEERCVKCKNYSKKLLKLNEIYKTFKRKNDDISDDDISDDDNKSSDCSTNGSNDNNNEQTILKKRITNLSKEFNVHREKHALLSKERVENITKDFVKIRDELRETMSLYDNNDSDIECKKYVPHSKQSSLLKKKLF
jgi:hypothetical protein